MDDFNNFIDDYEDVLIKDFFYAKTEKEFNSIFSKWYETYKSRGEVNNISYLLFLYHLLNWWFIILNNQ